MTPCFPSYPSAHGSRLTLTEPNAPDIVRHYRYDQVAANRLDESVVRWNLHHLLRPVGND